MEALPLQSVPLRRRLRDLEFLLLLLCPVVVRPPATRENRPEVPLRLLGPLKLGSEAPKTGLRAPKPLLCVFCLGRARKGPPEPLVGLVSRLVPLVPPFKPPFKVLKLGSEVRKIGLGPPERLPWLLMPTPAAKRPLEPLFCPIGRPEPPVPPENRFLALQTLGSNLLKMVLRPPKRLLCVPWL